MLVEITLLRSGYSDEKLEAIDPFASAARRYNVSLSTKNTVKSTSPKCGPKARSAMKSRKAKKTHVANKAVKKVAQKGGAA
jgi:hypothetical protein